MRAFAFALCLFAGGCASPAPSPIDPSQAQWDDALHRLRALRSTFPKVAYTEPVTVDFYEPYTRRHFDGRGAVGVDPGRAMRMILVGPAGEPALDVWVTRDAWRMSVPAIHLVKRGGVESPTSMPIGFFRSWFIEPLAGRLLALGREGALVVRDPFGGTLHISRARTGADGSSAHVVRRQETATETFAYTFDAKGGRATYTHGSTKLAVEVKVGPVQAEPPDPLAFVDPDAPPKDAP